MVPPDKCEVFKSLLLSIAISLWLYWLWTRRDLYRFSLKFPGAFDHPVLGSLNKIKNVNYLLTAFGNMFEKYRQHTICIWIGLYPVLLTDDPEFIEKILSSPDFLTKAKTMYDPLYKITKGGIISSPVGEWTHNRKMINPSFSHKVLVSFFPVFNKTKNSTIGRFKLMMDQKEHKLAEMLKRISLGISVETTMGKVMKEGDQVDEDLAGSVSFVMETTAKKCMLAFVKLDGLFWFYTKFNKTSDYLYKFIYNLIDQRIQQTNCMNANCEARTNTGQCTANCEDVDMKKRPNIFIDQAIEIYRKQQFSWNDIISESNTILTASFETTANAIFSNLVMLAMHPEYQERLFEEVFNVFPDKTFEMEYEHMQQLPYMDMVINETLRLTPPVPVIGRHVVRDTQFTKDLTLPKDLQIMISIFHLHRRTDVWGANADRFDPEHFLPENLSGHHPYAFMPFSKGMRNCIGWRYALYAIKVMLCGLIRNYRFTTDFKYEDLQFGDNITLRYINEPTFKIYERQ